tara:strand:- start:135 stop:518 length:384 start_codon:yes stop_codon:yes gene_type:complete
MTQHIRSLTGEPYEHTEEDLKVASTMDDTKVIAHDWVLKGGVSSRTVYDPSLRQHYADLDFRYTSDVRVIGTRRQLYLFFCQQLCCYAWQQQDSYDYDLDNSEKRDYYLKLYEENNFEPIALNIIRG